MLQNVLCTVLIRLWPFVRLRGPLVRSQAEILCLAPAMHFFGSMCPLHGPMHESLAFLWGRMSVE